jgi:CRP/FNR family transcriptional regulator, anaerobic regulatory protein
MNIWRHTTGRDSLYRASTRPAARMPDCAHCPVRDHSLCAGMNTSDLIRIAEKTDQIEAPSGAAIFYEGDPAQFFYTIREGVARLVRNFPDGRRSILGFLHGGDFLGGNFGGQFYNTTAEAVTKLQYFRVSVKDLKLLSDEYSGLNDNLSIMISDRLNAANDHIVLLSRKTEIERVSAFLLASSDWCGGSQRFDLLMARTDIADYLGLTIETIRRTITRLTEGQTISLHSHHKVEILDLIELKALARPESE